MGKRKGRVAQRKRLKVVKKGRSKPLLETLVEEFASANEDYDYDSMKTLQNDIENIFSEPSPTECAGVPQTSTESLQITEDAETNIMAEGMSTNSFVECHFHDYAKAPLADREEEHCWTSAPSTTAHRPSSFVFEELKRKVDFFLPSNWLSMLEPDGVSLILMSRDMPRVAQRHVFFHYLGSVDVSIHSYSVDSEQFVKDAIPPLPLTEETLNLLVDRVIFVLGKIRLAEVCAGVDSEKFQDVWAICPGGEIDKNLCRETRYVETFRAVTCSRLVNLRTWRCMECSKLLRPLRRRKSQATQDPKQFTPNVHLSKDQKLSKLRAQSKELDSARRKLKYLHGRVQEMIKKGGIFLDKDLDVELTQMLKSQNLTPAQEIFLHQQIKASNVKKKCSMRWHPTMIRLALSFYLNSPSAYEEMRSTGMIKLPSSRTLFDYTHVRPVEEGIDSYVLENLNKRIKLFTEKYQKYHVLLADEMYISRNLVFQKSTGRMIGYTKLDELDKEVRAMNAYLDNPDLKVSEPSLEEASRVLCYMVKGTANGIKEIIACYSVKNVSATQMYTWTWHVICALERCGLKVIAFICDGSPTNRAFINLHAPVTKLRSGVVMDTLNKAAPGRVLYFFSDVSHLLKTIRNCFYKSRKDPTKGKRCLRRRGKKIVWDFIIRLYKETKLKSLRKSYKLSPVNVFVDSYSCMKVGYAAQVLSLTVARDLQKHNYRGVSETVKFITKVNNWFDMLNGAHSSVGQKKKNINLYPYTSVDDKRFGELVDFLDDLDQWKCEAYNVGGDLSVNSTMRDDTMNASNTSEAEVTFDPVEDVEEEEEDIPPAAKQILSHQTLLGIEMTTRSFIKCTRFLLDEGTKFINARIFSQDPLEQHFSKQRMGCGGSTNPNLSQVLWKNRALHIKGQLGMKRPRGNTSEGFEHVRVTEEKLEKRKCSRLSL